VADLILLEKRGIPGAAICTEALQASANAMAAVQGIPGYRYAVVPHPVSSLDADGIRAHARIAAPQVLAILRGEPAGGERHD